ncbi:ribosome hibernation-promoting factor, HPF/YfiA family [Isachenkonia alkalipeptolytica]|uniref:Ribosome hibernation promoting factor n=1 Tax=Isachenkonia alkalipeptolytica TaxID=2565777 RepID=A0AA43XNF1_9CLOT|nr:ribosome-associated translation inhibitor RaiA [Isachenkonia alkalipeptolytica]NBG89394.1 ribosome-associated translation inhibitor RaiA [Isachenkonia alkalipeptolytica]
MKAIISGKNVGVTNALKETIESKLSKLDKFFHEDMEAQVTLSVEKERQIIEVTIPVSGSILRAEHDTDDMYASIDGVVDKLTRQLKKHKAKLQEKHKKGAFRFENILDYQPQEEEKEGKIVKTKRFAVKPMDAEEAVLQMELLGHNFFVFANGETDEVNVVYKRNDGDYGLIEPEYD